jgi:hypothetical protein
MPTWFLAPITGFKLPTQFIKRSYLHVGYQQYCIYWPPGKQDGVLYYRQHIWPTILGYPRARGPGMAININQQGTTLFAWISFILLPLPSSPHPRYVNHGNIKFVCMYSTYPTYKLAHLLTLISTPRDNLRLSSAHLVITFVSHQHTS